MSGNSIVQSLIDMGFTAENSEFAVKKCKSTNVQEVLDWMLQHTDDIDELRTAAESDTGVTAEAKSIQCNDCGKLFKSSEEVEFHAVKSGHANFSESTEEKKPLTEEEKREKLKELERVMKERRQVREEQEKLDNLEREKRRIQSGKEMVEVKKKLEDMEMKKMVDQRKREKMEEQLARERVRRQIEEDRNDRKMKFSNASNVETPQPIPPVTKSTTSATSYSESKIQIRLLDGTCVTQSFSAKDRLNDVRQFLEKNHLNEPIPFSLATTYPRRDFTTNDFEKTLESLNQILKMCPYWNQLVKIFRKVDKRDKLSVLSLSSYSMNLINMNDSMTAYIESTDTASDDRIRNENSEIIDIKVCPDLNFDENLYSFKNETEESSSIDDNCIETSSDTSSFVNNTKTQQVATPNQLLSTNLDSNHMISDDRLNAEFRIQIEKIQLEREKLAVKSAQIQLQQFQIEKDFEIKCKQIESDEKLSVLKLEKDERIMRYELELKYKFNSV